MARVYWTAEDVEMWTARGRSLLKEHRVSPVEPVQCVHGLRAIPDSSQASEAKQNQAKPKPLVAEEYRKVARSASGMQVWGHAVML